MIGLFIVGGYLLAGAVAARLVTNRYADSWWRNRHTSMCYSERGYSRGGHCDCFGWKIAAVLLAAAVFAFWPFFVAAAAFGWLILGDWSRIWGWRVRSKGEES